MRASPKGMPHNAYPTRAALPLLRYGFTSPGLYNQQSASEMSLSGRRMHAPTATCAVLHPANMGQRSTRNTHKPAQAQATYLSGGRGRNCHMCTPEANPVSPRAAPSTAPGFATLPPASLIVSPAATSTNLTGDTNVGSEVSLPHWHYLSNAPGCLRTGDVRPCLGNTIPIHAAAARNQAVQQRSPLQKGHTEC